RLMSAFFICQGVDGIRDDLVTGVQTCALPISVSIFPDAENKDMVALDLEIPRLSHGIRIDSDLSDLDFEDVRKAFSNLEPLPLEIGRASCRERGSMDEQRDRSEINIRKKARTG